MKTMKDYIQGGVTKEDRRLQLINKLMDEKPEGSKYFMLMPNTMSDMRNMGCSATLKYFHEVLDRRSLVFSIMNGETKKLASTIVCRMDSEENSYTYTLKTFEEESTELKAFEKECVVFAVKSLMRNKRVRLANHNSAHQAYNSLGCAAIQA